MIRDTQLSLSIHVHITEHTASYKKGSYVCIKDIYVVPTCSYIHITRGCMDNFAPVIFLQHMNIDTAA